MSGLGKSQTWEARKEADPACNGTAATHPPRGPGDLSPSFQTPQKEVWAPLGSQLP